VLNFAVTSIQVGVNPALSKDRFSFRTLHDKRGCYHPVEQKYLCPQCHEVAENTVRGFEFPKKSGNFIRITEEEFSVTLPKTRNIIKINKFVHDDMLNEMLFLDPYWLIPDDAAMYANQYAALKVVMLGKHKIGLGTVAFLDKEHPIALLPQEDALVLWTMTKPACIRVPDWELPLPDDLSLKMTEQIVSYMEDQVEDSDFETDSVQKRTALIDSKTAGIAVAPLEQVDAVPVVNVLDSLRDSIALLQSQKKRSPKKRSRVVT